MRFLYNIGIYLYQLAIFIASFFNTKAKKLRIGQADAFTVLKQKIIEAEQVKIVSGTDTYIYFNEENLI